MDIGLNILILHDFITHKYALENIFSKHKPNLIALQETDIVQKNKQFLHLLDYKVCHHNKYYDYAMSGIAIMVQNNINVVQQIKSVDELLFQTITVKGNKNLNITNIYKESNVALTTTMVNSINNFNNEHHLVVGDLNSQNTLWGSQKTSINGIVWEEFANELGLIVLNDGSADGSMASVDLTPCLNWMTLSSSETADHFPIIISNGGTIYRKRFQPKFLENRANWSAFSTKISCFMEEFNQFENIS